MIWHESGREDVDRLMEAGIEEMGSGRLRESIATFARIVGLAPEFAEGWNKRATAYYLAGELDASIRDVERTLALEPRHFGALSGLGLIYLARDDELGALRAFEATLKVHPRAPAAGTTSSACARSSGSSPPDRAAPARRSGRRRPASRLGPATGGGLARRSPLRLEEGSGARPTGRRVPGGSDSER